MKNKFFIIRERRLCRSTEGGNLTALRSNRRSSPFAEEGEVA